MTGTELEPTVTKQIERFVGELSLDDIARLGQWMALASSGSKDAKVLGAANALKMMFATSMGFPLTAAPEIHLIQGQFVLSAKLCRALGPSHGVRVIPVEETADSCTAAVIEIATGKELGRRTYTLAMAAKRGLKGNNWTVAPDRMLWARASKMVLDDFAPWVTVGIMSQEQVAEMDVELAEEVLSGEVLDPDDVPFGNAD